MKGLVHTDVGGYYNLHAREKRLKLIFKEAWQMKTNIFLD